MEGLLETKKTLSNSVRDEFSVTLKIAVTIKIDVTEKLSRNQNLILDLILSKKTVACIKKVKSRYRGRGIWIDTLVVRLFTLSFCLKKKA